VQSEQGKIKIKKQEETKLKEEVLPIFYPIKVIVFSMVLCPLH